MSRDCLAHQIHRVMGTQSPGPDAIEAVLTAQAKVARLVLSGDTLEPDVNIPGLGVIGSRYPIRRRHNLPRAVYFWPAKVLEQAVANGGE